MQDRQFFGIAPQFAWRWTDDPRHLGHRYGAVGYFGQPMGRAGVPAAGRPVPGKDLDVPQPEGPGLGVVVDERKAIEVGKDPDRPFKWPDARLRDGSVAEY